MFVIERAFSTTECATLLAAAELHGFGRTNYSHAYRGNLRLLAKDEGLAFTMWQRLSPFVPATLTDDVDGDTWDAVGMYNAPPPARAPVQLKKRERGDGKNEDARSVVD